MTSEGTTTYAAHGYLVGSELPLPLPLATTTLPAEPDLLVRRGAARDVPLEMPPGDLLAHLMDDRVNTYYAFSQDASSTTLRFFRAVELVGDRDLCQVTTHQHLEFPSDIAPVVAGGALLAVRLMLDGHLVLHASAVESTSGAIAFVGASGMGKTTMATMLASRGLPVLTDDVLRVDLDDAATVWPGASELRLRPTAESLAGADAHRTTADGRIAVAPRLSTAAAALGVVAIPSPRRDLLRPEVERLSGSEAMTRMLAFPRVSGWQHGPSLVRQFERLGALSRAVPVVILRMPWGPPFDDDVVDEALDLLLDVAQR